MSTAAELQEAIEAGTVSDRLWLYTNYHCNLRCVYCLTESAPGVERRVFDADQMVRAADEGKELGYRSLGVTGGEPFLMPYMPEVLAQLAERLPLVVMSNATLFTDKVLKRMAPLADLPVMVQISLDSAEPDVNDEFRAPHNFEKVVTAIPRLVEMGITVRVATTGDHNTPAQLDRLCELHLSLGVPEENHIVRGIVHRGRAKDTGMGAVADHRQIHPELTLTADGAFWSPFAPTVNGGRLDTDLLVTRQRFPVEEPTRSMLALAGANPDGTDPSLNLRCG